MVLGYPSKKSQNHGNPYAWKIFITLFELFGQFFFQNDIFKLQEDFSELGIRVILENDIGSFQTFLILQIWDEPEVLKRFQKHFWKQVSKPKKPRILWFSENTLWSLSQATQCFWKIHWGLSQEPDVLENFKNRVGTSTPILSKISDINYVN
jgi:hypothetical protein